ncbi:hypothetical protein [Thermotoga sp. SG1]|nr:hypothetical protein [Thermotoga sp. SG1]
MEVSKEFYQRLARLLLEPGIKEILERGKDDNDAEPEELPSTAGQGD